MQQQSLGKVQQLAGEAKAAGKKWPLGDPGKSISCFPLLVQRESVATGDVLVIVHGT